MADNLPALGEKRPDVLELNQFWRYGGSTYCFNSNCDECKFVSTCSKEEVVLKIGPGINIRRAFVAPPGFKIVSIDYKGIELRVAAQLSEEPVWVKAFQNNEDLHQEMAKIAFKTPNPSKEQRGQAKCANFGNLFLGTAQTLARQSDLSVPEAIYVHREWWKAVPAYKRWTDLQLEYAKKHKKVKTFFGRVRHLEDLISQAEGESTSKKGGKSGWGFVHRTSVNSPVQGCLPYITKIFTSEGLIPIGKLYERQNSGKTLPQVWTGNKFAQFSVLNRGKAKLVDLHIKRRGILKCDDRHKVKVVRENGWEWVDIKELKETDQVAIARPVCIKNETQPDVKRYSGASNNSRTLNIDVNSKEWYYFVGFLLGDGCFGIKTTGGYWIELIVMEGDETAKKKVQDVLKSFGLDVLPYWKKKDPEKRRESWSISSIALGKALIEFGLVPSCGAPNKKIPESAYTGSYEARRSLMQGVFDTDGTKHWEGWGWHNSSEDLIRGIYLMLRTLGVDSRYSKTVQLTWKLDIASKSKFSEEFGFGAWEKRVNGGRSLLPFQTEEVYSVLEAMPELSNSAKTIRSRLKNGGTTALITAERITGKFFEEHHLYDEVEKIDFLEEEEETYTLSVLDEYHQFDSEGVISKNTAADLMKLAIVRVVDWVRKENLRDIIRLLMTVHDELVFQIKDDEHLPDMCDAIAKQMCPDLSGFGWKVPIEVDVEFGDNWADLMPLSALKEKRGVVTTENKTEITVAKPRIPSDKCILVLNTSLTRFNLQAVELAIMKASVDNGQSVMVPLKIKLAGNEYRSGSGVRVHEPTLRSLVIDIPGVTFEDD